MANNTKQLFRELAISKATKQTGMVNQLLEEAPIIAGMPMQPSTDGFKNVYEEITDVTGASLIDLDDQLAEVGANTELKETSLSILGGTMFVGEDKARQLGGAAAYFNMKQPLVLRKTGEDLEKAIVYNNLRAYTVAEGTARSAGGSSNTNYSIVAVTWMPGEVTGLYDPAGYGNGKVFDVEAINGGNLYEKTINGKTILGYGVRLKSTLGIQLANSRYVSSLVNIDLDSATKKPPTEEMLDELLLNCRQNTSTVLYMHPRVLTHLYNYKRDKLQVVNGDSGIDSRVVMYNGTPIVASYNFVQGTEQNVTIV